MQVYCEALRVIEAPRGELSIETCELREQPARLDDCCTTARAAPKTALQARLRIHLLLARTSTTRAIRTLAPHRVPLLSKVPAHKLSARRSARRRHRCGAVRDT